MREALPDAMVGTRRRLSCPAALAGALAVLASVEVSPLAAASIAVSFSGMSSDEGQALFALFDAAEGFPDDAGRAAARLTGDIVSGIARVVFDNVAPGDYALSALHDANGSGAIDLNFLGIPKEKFAVSNVAKGRPSWEQARFTVEREGDTLIIELRPLRFF